MSEMPLESPSEDVAEQRADAYPAPGRRVAVSTPLEADAADALDQADEVPVDEDDYR